MTIIHDFYKGYEGETEITISQKDSSSNVVESISLWSGYLNKLIDLLKPNENGYWEGLSLYYHTFSAWYDEPIWKAENSDLKLFINQLQNLDCNNLSTECKAIHKVLVSMFQNSINLKHDVYFEYF